MRRARARRLLATLGVAAAGLAARGVLAHHSPARYDLQAQRTVEGTIAEYEWGNPHVYLSVRENGSDRVWVVEAYPSTAMKQYGWAADTFARGDVRRRRRQPGRDASRNILFLQMHPQGRLRRRAVRLGRRRGRRSPNQPAEIFRADEPRGHVDELRRARRSGRSSGPASRRSPRRKARRPSPSSATRRIPASSACRSQPPVYMILPGFRSIEVRGDAVTIRGEDAAVDRVVHLDVATHDGAAPSVHGHSIGRWDGGTLVVDTAQFAPHRLGNGAGLPSGAGKHLVERFALNADGGLTYSFELEDPEYLKERVTGTSQWLYRPDVEYVATPCDRDNARRFLAE